MTPVIEGGRVVDFKWFPDRGLTRDPPAWSCGGTRIGKAELPVASPLFGIGPHSVCQSNVMSPRRIEPDSVST